jgi:hypothetical protein
VDVTEFVFLQESLLEKPSRLRSGLKKRHPRKVCLFFEINFPIAFFVSLSFRRSHWGDRFDFSSDQFVPILLILDGDIHSRLQILKFKSPLSLVMFVSAVTTKPFPTLPLATTMLFAIASTFLTPPLVQLRFDHFEATSVFGLKIPIPENPIRGILCEARNLIHRMAGRVVGVGLSGSISIFGRATSEIGFFFAQSF